MENWTPQSIIEVVKVFETGTFPILVETDAGMGVLKLPSRCIGGPVCLISEFVGSCLASLLEVPVPDFALIRADRDFVEMMRPFDESFDGEEVGFISQFEAAAPFTPQLIQDVKNRDCFTKIVFLDTWIRNEDRYFKKTGESSSRNTNNVLLVVNGQAKEPYTLKAIDHSEAFRSYLPSFKMEDHFGQQAIDDPKIYGQFPEFTPLLDKEVAGRVSERLASINKTEIQAIFGRIPKSWKLTASAKKAFITFVVKRAAFVAGTLVGKLFPEKITLFD